MDFPIGSSDDELDELHADLVFADSCVADDVIPFVKGQGYTATKFDIGGLLSGLIARSERLASSRTGEFRGAAIAYGKYASILLRVHGLFLEVVDAS